MKLQDPLKNLDLRRWPDGNVMQSFGENPHLYWRFGFPGGHNGIDCYTHENDEVIASCDGWIVKSDYGKTSFGKGVWQVSKPYDNDQRALLIVYFHLNEIFVSDGQEVKAGDVIGLQGNTGFVVSGNTPYWGNAPAGKGVHLHYGVYPLVLREQERERYVINGKHYIKEFAENGFRGAVDPLTFHRTKVEVQAIRVIERAKRIIKKVVKFLIN